MESKRTRSSVSIFIENPGLSASVGSCRGASFELEEPWLTCCRGEGERTLPLKTLDRAIPWFPRSMSRVWRPMRLLDSPSSSDPSLPIPLSCPRAMGEGALMNEAFRPDMASLAFSRSLSRRVRLVMVDLD